MGLGEEDVQGVKAGVLPLHAGAEVAPREKLTAVDASPKGRTCAMTVFNPRERQLSSSWAAPARNASSEEKSNSAHSR